MLNKINTSDHYRLYYIATLLIWYYDIIMILLLLLFQTPNPKPQTQFVFMLEPPL